MKLTQKDIYLEDPDGKSPDDVSSPSLHDTVRYPFIDLMAGTLGRWPRTCIMELLILLNLVWKIQYLNVALSVIPDSAAQQMSTANHHGGSFGNLP